MSKPMFAQPEAKGRVEIADKYGDVICKASGEYERDSILKCIVSHDRMTDEIAELKNALSVLSDADNHSVSQVRMAMRKSRELLNK